MVKTCAVIKRDLAFKPIKNDPDAWWHIVQMSINENTPDLLVEFDAINFSSSEPRGSKTRSCVQTDQKRPRPKTIKTIKWFAYTKKKLYCIVHTVEYLNQYFYLILNLYFLPISFFKFSSLEIFQGRSRDALFLCQWSHYEVWYSNSWQNI